MPETVHVQQNFTSGVFSPRLRGRVDLAQYYNALETLENFIVQPHGGIERRPGTEYIAATKGTNTTRLIPFSFSADDTYILEFGNQYIRFYRNGGQILDAGSPVEVSAPYAPSELKQLKFAQSADILYLVHPNHQPRTLSRVSDTDWTLETFATENGPYIEPNLDKKHKIKMSAAFGAEHAITVVDDGDGHFTVAGDQTSDISAGELIEVRSSTANDGVYTVVSRSLNGGATEIFVSEDILDTTVDGDIRFPHDITATKDTFAQEDADNYRLLRWRKGTPGTWGWGYITQFTDAKTARVLAIETFGTTGGSRRWRLGAFGEPTNDHPVESAGWPSVVTFHDQRLWFANTQGKPQTIYGSRPGDFIDFAPTEADGSVDEDTGLDLPLDSNEVQSIHWIKSTAKGLALGTASGEWIISAGSETAAITSSNGFAEHQTTYGSRPYPDAVLFGTGVIYPSRTGRILRLFGFEFSTDQFASNDLTKFSEHIFKNTASPNSGIREMLYIDEPDSNVWVLTDANTLHCLTIDQEQQVLAWDNHTIGGTDAEVISIASINESPNPQLWMVVRRTINGATAQYVEKLSERFDQLGGQEDAFFVDSGLRYEGAPATVISGLDHLEGETIKVLGDGAVFPDATVSGGSVTLESSVSCASFGLGYTSTAVTMPIEPRSSRVGDPRGHYKRIVWTLVQMHRSLGGSIGWRSENDNGTTEIVYRTFADLLGNPPALVTGMRKVSIESDSERLVNLAYETDDPLPMNILSFISQMEVGGT